MKPGVKVPGTFFGGHVGAGLILSTAPADVMFLTVTHVPLLLGHNEEPRR